MTLLSGLGQAAQFSEEALQALLVELQQTRAERASVEAQIESIRTGRPVRAAGVPGRAQAQVSAPPTEFPGGTVDLPVIGKVPTVSLVVAGISAFMYWRRK